MSKIEIIYTSHAENKFKVLRKYGVSYTKTQIEDILLHPDSIKESEKGRMVAQKAMSKTHLIRVIYEKRDNILNVITFYPARRERYENEL